ncbi:response regulator [Streptomyces sp. NPDC001514]
MVRVVVVDDEPLIRAGLKYILAAENDVTVAAVASTGDAVAVIQENRPDVVLLDIRMPDMDGLTVLAAITEMESPPAVCMLSRFDAEEHFARALECGVGGFLHKETDLEQLGAMVRFLADGGLALSGRAGRAARAVLEGHGATKGPQMAGLEPLTARERDILILLAEGLTNCEIAERLYLGIGTVKDYVSSIFSKLGVTNRVQAALAAERAGLLPAVEGGEGVPKRPMLVSAAAS